MAATQETATRTLGTTSAVTRRSARPRARQRRLAIVAVLCLIALGALAYGIYGAVDGAGTEADPLLRRAEASAAHLNAQAEFFATDTSAFSSAMAAPSARAIEAYGARWAALAPNEPGPAAIEAYGARWQALGARYSEGAADAAALGAYRDRWVALGDQYAGS